METLLLDEIDSKKGSIWLDVLLSILKGYNARQVIGVDRFVEDKVLGSTWRITWEGFVKLIGSMVKRDS